MQGTTLGGSEPNRAGRDLEAHCPGENTEAQSHSLVGVSLGESSLAFC